MAYTSTSLSLFSEGPTAEHIEYALPTPDSLPTTTYHHIQHFLPDGTPSASSTHIEYADDPSFSFSFSFSSTLSEVTLPFARRRPATTTTHPRREQGTERPSTSPSTTTSTSSSPSRSPSVHVRFAGALPLPPRPSSSSSPPPSSASTATSQATDSRSKGGSTSRNRPSSPYPFVRGGRPPDVCAQEGGGAVGSSRSEGEGEEVALSTYAHATTVARTAFVDREEVWDESGFWVEEE